MATIQYVVSAQDAASATFERIAGSADHVLEKLDEIGAKTAKARVGLEGDDKATLAIDKLDLKMANLAKRVANGKIGVEGQARALLDIRKLELEMDKLNAKRSTVHIDTSALSKLSAFQPSAIGTAVALSPTLIPLLSGVAAGAAAVAVSFGAAGLAAGAFGLIAKSVLTNAGQDATKLATLQAQLAKDTTAKQKAATQQQITALESGWSNAYTSLVTSYQQFTSRWEKLSASIATPALAAWFGALNKAIVVLRPALQPVADLFEHWGKSIARYFADPITVLRVKNMAATFGNFAAIQLGQIAKFVTDLAKGIFNLGKDFADNGAVFGAAGTWLLSIGAGFLSWSKSAAARNDVHGFMKFIHDEGPVIKGILQDLGTLLPGIFAGATTVGTLELQALGNFLNLVASLPPGWEKPVTELAGAMLLLSKIGVVKIGIQLTGLGLSGLGAAGAGAAGGPLAAAGAAIAAGLVLRVREDLKKGFKGIVNDLPTFLSGSTGVLQVAASGWTDVIVNRFQKPALAAEKAFGRAFVASAKADWNAVTASMRAFAGDMVASMKAFGSAFVASARAAWNAVTASFRAFAGTVTASMRAFGSAVASIWNTIWRNTRNAVSTGISAVVANFRTLTGRVLSALTGLGHSLGSFAAAALNEMLAGFKRVGGSITSWFSSFGKSIISVVKKVLGVFSPSSVFFDIGVNLMKGLENGVKHGVGAAQKAAQVAANRVANVGSGVQRWAPLVRQALAMEGLSPGLLRNVLYQMSTESGGNPNAINNTDINARNGQNSRGLMQVIPPTFAAYHWPGTSNNIYNPLANIAAALNYARHVYGPSLMSGGQGIGSGHGYDSGGWLPTGASVAVNNTGRPELVVGPATMAQVVALLAQILRAVQIAPAATSAGTAKALNSAARGALGAR